MERIKKLNKILENKMTGINYVTEWDIIELGSAYNLQDLKNKVYAVLPDSKEVAIEFERTNLTEFWNAINTGFYFRGDSAAGMNLNTLEEENLNVIQDEYKTELKFFLKQSNEIYTFNFEDCLPLYPVFWGFCFVIGNWQNWYLIYGVSSD